MCRSFTALVLFCATATPAFAQQEVKIGIGFGLAFLPVYVCEDLKLIEKHAKEAHLDVKASFPRFMGAAQLQDAVVSGAIDVGPFGTAPLLAAWQKAKDTPAQIFAVSGMTSLPLVLLSNQPNEQSIADIAPGEHIAMPTLTSPQMYLLELQAEKTFGQYDRLNGQVVALSHADAIAGLVEGAGQSTAQITAYFSSPPFTQFALRAANVHPLLRSSDVMGGKSSFLIMGATKAYIDAQAQMPDVIDKAMDEAARIIHALGLKPRRTIRVALWSGEEEGLLGSAAYVKQHFGSFEDPKPEYAKLDCYFNIDSGTGRVRGASIFGPAAAADILSAALEPFKDWAVGTANATTSRATGGTDSTNFNAAGLPGIGLQQDPIDYQSFTWHTNLDTYERIVPEDVKQAATEIASAVWTVANSDQMIPRLSKAEMPAK